MELITLNKSRYSFNENTLFCVLSVIVFCAVFTICATTSPLFAFCEESHCFFSVGKAILHGRVLYRDILEQKGLLIYLIQIPAYLISRTTFLGVWIIQTILMAITAFFGYKTALEAKLSPTSFIPFGSCVQSYSFHKLFPFKLPNSRALCSALFYGLHLQCI